MEKFDRIKKHWQDNKDRYIFGSVGIVVGAGLVVIFRNTSPTVSVAPIFNNTPEMTNIVNNTSNFAGTMSKITECLETGELWKTMTDAAKAADVPLHVMSKHINGYPGYETINNMHYGVVGLSAAA